MSAYAELMAFTRQTQALGQIAGRLGWDQETMMPEGAAPQRGEEMAAMGWMNPDGTIPPAIQAMFKTPEQGASTSIWAATSEQLNEMGGLYCENCDVAQLATEDSLRWEHVRDWVCDETKAEKLWAMSEKMLAEV